MSVFKKHDKKIQRKTAVLLVGCMMLVHFSSPLKIKIKRERDTDTKRGKREKEGESAHAVFKNND